MKEKDVVMVRISHHFTMESQVKDRLLDAAKAIEDSMAVQGYQVKWKVEPFGIPTPEDTAVGAIGSTVGILGPPPKGYDLHPVEEAIEAANLDREDSAAGRRIQGLLKCNTEEVAQRRVAEQQTGRRDIIIEALLDSIEMGRD